MKCKIIHESVGRMRIHAVQKSMTLQQADMLEYYLKMIDGITSAKVYDRTGDAVIIYTTKRETIITALSAFTYESQEPLSEYTGRELNRMYEDKLIFAVSKRIFNKLFLPTPIRTVLLIFKTIRYLRRGLSVLARGKLEVPVPDAAAVTSAMVHGDHSTASSIMCLLEIGEILEECTHKKSVNDLARSMALNVKNVWKKEGATEKLVGLHDICVGDSVVVRTGNIIPLDGRVIVGQATVNQASITGEALPVFKESGSYVYAGTVVEEGECVICVEQISGSGKYDKIVHMIEESEKLKSSTEDKASHLADKLVPYSLAGTILTYIFTHNVTKALSVLLVDFSCALKLAMPIAVLSAMKESSKHDILVKGGKFLEAVSCADTIVFDKTGTLTYAAPKVAKVITFGDRDENEMLRLAACLEEHYPHSMAKAVVTEARERDLHHEERHSRVEYVVAHGISSIVDDKKVIIGSYHFVFQDESCRICEGEQEKFDKLPDEYSHLYMAVSGELAAVICIEDLIRKESGEVISELRKLGIGKIVMMTGDSDRTAKVIAEAIGADEYYAEVLPEDKAAFVKGEHEKRRTVVMIGDGINDSPALSEADAGIAISTGAAIAREIADITISTETLSALITLKMISDALMIRIKKNYHGIVSFNLLLICLGVLGVIQPATSALLHNISTIAISLKSMTNLLK